VYHKVFVPYKQPLTLLILFCYLLLDFPLQLQSAPISTNVTSLNPAHGNVYSIKLDMIHFFSDLRQEIKMVFSEFSGFCKQWKWPTWW
jgi:hypothetical protein